ncbi:MAG: type II toxin-antitoxin system VapC family toxin [Aridibacter sp.]
MKVAFVDTQYFVAVFQESDQWHKRAVELESRIVGYNFVTTDSVLCEVLNYFSGYGKETRKEVSAIISDILNDESFQVIEQTREVFLKGLELYESRLDKGYSLTDCISMNACSKLGITEILTHDHHFQQEDFSILL